MDTYEKLPLGDDDEAKRTTRSLFGFVWAGSIFVVCLSVLCLIESVRGFFIFPYDLLAVQDGPRHWRHILIHQEAVNLGLVQWTAVAVVFAGTLRRIRPLGLFVPLSFITIFLVVIVAYMIVRALGMDYYWDIWH